MLKQLYVKFVALLANSVSACALLCECSNDVIIPTVGMTYCSLVLHLAKSFWYSQCYTCSCVDTDFIKYIIVIYMIKFCV